MSDKAVFNVGQGWGLYPITAPGYEGCYNLIREPGLPGKSSTVSADCAKVIMDQAALLRQVTQAQENFAIRVLGQERYDNSPCQAHSLELVEMEVDELRKTAENYRKVAQRLSERIILLEQANERACQMVEEERKKRLDVEYEAADLQRKLNQTTKEGI